MAGEVEVRPARRFIVQHLVLHDMKEYPIGAEFPESDATPEQIAALRKVGALKLREEIDAADTIAARQAELEAENNRLRVELEALRAAPEAEANATLAAIEAEQAERAATEAATKAAKAK